MRLSRKRVQLVVAASIVSTAVHYADNYLYVAEYPQPAWVNREMIAIAWLLMTMIGVAGYLFFAEGRPRPAGWYLLVYSYTGLSSLGHYTSGSMDDFTTKMHVLIWMDGIVGLAVALTALSLLLRRTPQPSY